MAPDPAAARPASIPPPNWTPPSAIPALASVAVVHPADASVAVVHPADASVAVVHPADAGVAVAHAGAKATLPTEAAIRWRIEAALIDNILVYAFYLVICGAIGWRVAAPAHLLALIVIGVLYHWAQESRDGQTIGKRQYGIRVEALDGQKATPKAIALRSLFRTFDQLPMFYCSGLFSVVRTGPARRQRIGDVVGGTIVVAAEGRSKQRGTAGWVLPAATIVATLASAALVFSIVRTSSAQISDTQRAEFIAGCEQTSNGALDCGCLLDSLESRGYDSIGSMETLFEQGQSALASRDPAAVPAAMTAAARACHR